MKKKYLALVIIVVAAMFLASCSLFGGKEGDEGPDLKKMTYYVPGDYFVTNVKDSDMLCKVSVGLAMTKDQTAFMETNQVLIRDTIVKILRDKTSEQLLAVDAVDVLSQEMSDKLKEVLKIEELYSVYISDFVVQ